MSKKLSKRTERRLRLQVAQSIAGQLTSAVSGQVLSSREEGPSTAKRPRYQHISDDELSESQLSHQSSQACFDSICLLTDSAEFSELSRGEGGSEENENESSDSLNDMHSALLVPSTPTESGVEIHLDSNNGDEDRIATPLQKH